MTRSRVLTLTYANQWYNLYALLMLDPSQYTGDITFATTPFLPKMVNYLKYQVQNAITNPNNGGAVVSFAFDSQNESGIDLTSGSWDVISTQDNNIVLDQISVKSTIAGATINVAFSNN